MGRWLRTLALLAIVASCAPQGPARTDHVRIFDDPNKPEREWGYAPAWIKVPLGTTVTFTNQGAVFHTVTSSGDARVIFPPPTSPAQTPSGRAFDIGASPGERVTLRFDKPGTWEYHCGIHPDMKGIVEVCDGACR